MACVLALLLQAADAKTVAGHVHGLFLEGRWEGALAAYRRMPDPPPQPALDDREAARALRDYREHRSAAHWQASHCYARLGRWEEARQAFHEARVRWPRSSWCGNAAAEFAVEGAVAEALCLENLGRHEEAVELYVESLRHHGLASVDRPAARVVELHAAAGALEPLEARMARMDLEFRKKLLAAGRDAEGIDAFMKYAPSAPLRPFWEAARRTSGAWTSPLPKAPGELPFPSIPKNLKLP